MTKVSDYCSLPVVYTRIDLSLPRLSFVSTATRCTYSSASAPGSRLPLDSFSSLICTFSPPQSIYSDTLRAFLFRVVDLEGQVKAQSSDWISTLKSRECAPPSLSPCSKVVVFTDARRRVPFSVFPSTYKTKPEVAGETQVRTEETVTVQDAGREGRGRFTTPGDSRRDDNFRESVHVTEEQRFRPGRVTTDEDIRISDRYNDRRETRVEDRYHEPYRRYADAQIDVEDRVYDRTAASRRERVDVDVDVHEREYRDRVRAWDNPREPVSSESINVRERVTVDGPAGERRHRLDMGYYDEDGHYHSIRHGLHRAADRILYGKEHHHHDSSVEVDREEDIVIKDRQVTTMSSPRYSSERSRSGPPNTITIPCHYIRIGDLLILQGRPCQVIRITTSAQTGQHRYLGVDLFTKQLQEESSFISNPSPSVVVQNMLGPVFKQYRVLDIRGDGRVVAMTETGDVKQDLPVLDQSNLSSRLADAFNEGRGSVRVLVINDAGRELAVDYKTVHGSRL